MKEVSDSDFTVFEIYPRIYVYKNLFKDIGNTYKLFKDSTNNDEENFFNVWSPWSNFGDYINPPTNKFPEGVFYDGFEKYGNIDKAIATTELQKNQKNALLEIIDNFYLATYHYAKKHNIDLDQETKVKTANAGERPMWISIPPTVCKYNITPEYDQVTMSYHTDYRRADADKPDYKFVITALAYINDDYEGGEIDFYVNKKLVKYKPEAGDFLVFPSGHPDYLTEEDSVYLHGVLPTRKNNKYFARMFWQKYYEGSEYWFEQEKKYGAEKWWSMQPALEKEYNDTHVHRSAINAERIQ